MESHHPIDEAAAEVSKLQHLRYFPFWQQQRITEPIKCEDDASLVLVELPGSVLHPMAKRWTATFEGYERVQLMRLFVFALQCACDCGITVALETVVNGDEFEGIDAEVLNNDTDVVAYRLWIPLDSATEVSFLSAVNSALASDHAVNMTTFTHGPKRRKVDMPEPLNIPSYLRRIPTFEELSLIVRSYYMGQHNVDVAPFADTDVESTETARMAFTRVMDATHQFSQKAFVDRCANLGVHPTQQQLQNYITTMPGTGVRGFYPSHWLRSKGLVRNITTGTCKAFLRNAPDLFRYCLPQYAPSIEELRTKLYQVLAARGTTTVDLSAMSFEELIELSGSEDEDAVFQDPHTFSPIVVSKTADITAFSASFYMTARDNQYPLVPTMHRRFTNKRQYAARSGNSMAVVTCYRRGYHDITTLLESNKLTGIPPVYMDLAASTKACLSVLHAPTCAGPTTEKLAWALFNASPTSELHTGYAETLCRLTHGSNDYLGLVGPQKSIWMLLWLQNFSTTRNTMEPSFFGILIGKSDVGKSKACETVIDCVPPSAVFQSDGGSSKVMTVWGPEHDMRIVYSDELDTSSAKSGDAGNDIGTKLKQSALSSGVITYSAKVRNPTTGQWEEQRTVRVLRTMTIANTNFAHRIAPAMESRAVIFAVASSKDTHVKSVMSTRNAQVATKDMRVVKLKYDGWTNCLQAYAGLQYRYTLFETIGLIPEMDCTLFVVFSMMLFHRFGAKIMSGRQIIALKRFALSCRIFDLVSTWHTRGLGKKYNFDPGIEIMFYASASYMTAQSIVAAYTLLEQTTSTDEVYARLVGHIKDSIAFDGHSAITHGDYYVSRYHRPTLLIQYLEKMMSDCGKGTVNKMYGVAEAGVTKTGQLYIIQEPHEHTEKLMYHRAFIAAVRSPIELAILRSLRAIMHDPRYCVPCYDDEEHYVLFKIEVMGSLFDAPFGTGSIDHPELLGKSKEHVMQALSYLKDTIDADDNPMFEDISEGTEAVYVPALTPGAVPSSLGDGRFKTRKTLMSPTRVNRALLMPKLAADSMTDTFVRDFLCVAGGYNDGKRAVFAGIRSAVSGPDSDPNHTIVLPSDYTTAYTFENKFYAKPSSERMMLGVGTFEAFIGDDDVYHREQQLQDAIFPPTAKTVTFTETSHIERRVAEHALGNICPGSAYVHDFTHASLLY